MAIKSYSPEVMVSTVYNTNHIHKEDEQNEFVNRVTSVFPRLHGLVIGPGMGRNPFVLKSVEKIVERAKEIDLPLVLDADGLFLLSQKPELLKHYHNAVITPNIVEYRRISEAMKLEHDADISEFTKRLGGPTVIRKGRVDTICGFSGDTDAERVTMICDARGSPRRPGGLGDFLAGTTIVLLSWSVRRYGGTSANLTVVVSHPFSHTFSPNCRYEKNVQSSYACMSCCYNRCSRGKSACL